MGIYIMYTSWIIVSASGMISYIKDQDIFCIRAEVKADEKQWKRDAAFFGHLFLLIVTLFFWHQYLFITSAASRRKTRVADALR